jgi:replication protein
MPQPARLPHVPTSPKTSLKTETSFNKTHLITLLEKLGDGERARATQHCSTTFRVLTCPRGHLAQAIPTRRCGHRLCPDCARWRRARAVNRLRPALRRCQRDYPHDRWVLITLTIQASHEPLPTRLTRLKGYVTRLRRSKDWQNHIRGGVISYELPYDPDTGAHVHAHILARQQASWPQAALAAQWQRLTAGAGQVVDIRHLQTRQAGIVNVLTYVLKPTDLRGWGPEQLRDFHTLGRRKLSETFGVLRRRAPMAARNGKEPGRRQRPARALTSGDPCPTCRQCLERRWVWRPLHDIAEDSS